jgi:hypothetical protein
MAYKKGEYVEHGIWRRAEDKGYLVEVSVTCADTGKRIRKRKTIGRLDLARAWKDTVRADGIRGEITREEKRKEITFTDFADEYLSVWGQKRRASTVSRERTLIEGVLKPCFGTRDLRSINRRDIEVHIAKRLSGEIAIKRKDGIKVSSANRELCRLKHMLAMAEDWDISNKAQHERLSRNESILARQATLRSMKCQKSGSVSCVASTHRGGCRPHRAALGRIDGA